MLQYKMHLFILKVTKVTLVGNVAEAEVYIRLLDEPSDSWDETATITIDEDGNVELPDKRRPFGNEDFMIGHIRITPTKAKSDTDESYIFVVSDFYSYCFSK